jgi:hypothetical protein
VVRRGVALILAGAAAACARGGESASDSSRVAAVPAPSATAAPDTGCPKFGAWRSCSVEDRLTRAGLVIDKKDEAIRYPFFSVAGTAYGLGGGEDELQVFVYETTAQRTADTERLDSARAAPRDGERPAYRVPPLLVTSNNLAALVFTINERTSERLSLALSAGLPPR